MNENENVIDVTDEPEETTESEFPWKPVIAALVVGATSAAVAVKIKAHRKNKAEAAPEETPEVPAEPTTKTVTD